MRYDGTARTALLVMPLYFGLVVLADEFVLQVFGPNWVGMVDLLRIIAIASLVQSIGNVTGPLLMALNRTKLIMQMNFVSVAFYFSALLVTLPFGLKAIAAGYALSNTLICVASVFVSLRVSNISIVEYLKSISRPLLWVLVMCAVIIVGKLVLPGAGVLHFAGLVILGAITYTGLVLCFEKEVWIQILSAIRKH